MPFPIAAVASGLQGIGNLAGGFASLDANNQAQNAYQQYLQKGIGGLQTGMQGANAAFNPYTTTGAAGASGELAAIQNRQQAQMPTATNSSPGQALASYLNPSAAYTMDQANKATQAQGIAGGALGGGFLKALSNNANKMAMTNYNDAYNQMINTNAQNFGQGQQLYQNNTDYQQQQIGNLGNIANRGLQANTANQGIQQGYNNKIAGQYNDLGSGLANLANQKGAIENSMWSGAGNTAGGMASSIWGKK